MDEGQVEAFLERLDLQPKDRGRYWVIRCPRHVDRQPSAQCFKNDGFISCLAGCGRFHINEVARERGLPEPMPGKNGSQTHVEAPRSRPEPKDDTPTILGDFTEMWTDLELIDSTTMVKGVPASVLNVRGWRKWPGGNGTRPGLFIPYFNITRSKVVFYQIRHLEGDRRFTFAPGCTPICYGQEMLQYCKRFLCFTEGSRDSVILGMAGVPAVALPSAGSTKILSKMLDWCAKNSVRPVAVCDRDEAGEKLISDLDAPVLDFRTPVGKDVGDFFEKEGLDAVAKYYDMFKEVMDGKGEIQHHP